MGLIKGLFHPNRIKRAQERAAEEQAANLRKQEAEYRQAAEQQKTLLLTQITNTCTDLRSQIATWHQAQIASAKANYQQQLAAHRHKLSQLKKLHQQTTNDITTKFQAYQQQLNLNKQHSEQQLEQQAALITHQAQQQQDQGTARQHSLATLTAQTKAQLFDQDILTAYSHLKTPDHPVKLKNYSLVVGYLQALWSLQLIRQDDLVKYQNFLYGLCTEQPPAATALNFQSIDHELINLFHTIALEHHDLVASAAQQVQQNIDQQTKQLDHLTATTITHISALQQSIQDQYQQALLHLTNEHAAKQQACCQTYQEVLTEINRDWLNYKLEQQQIIQSLAQDQQQKLTELNNQELAEVAKVNQQHQLALNELQTKIQQQLAELNQRLAQHLKKLDRAHNISVINGTIFVAAAAFGYVCPELLAGAGVSAELIGSVQASLALTSAGAFKNFMQQKEQIGIKLQGNISLVGNDQASSSAPRVNSNHANSNRDPADSATSSTDLLAIQTRFRQFSQTVESWQATTAHQLFYSLPREVTLAPPPRQLQLATSSRAVTAPSSLALTITTPSWQERWSNARATLATIDNFDIQTRLDRNFGNFLIGGIIGGSRYLVQLAAGTIKLAVRLDNLAARFQEAYCPDNIAALYTPQNELLRANLASTFQRHGASFNQVINQPMTVTLARLATNLLDHFQDSWQTFCLNNQQGAYLAAGDSFARLTLDGYFTVATTKGLGMVGVNLAKNSLKVASKTAKNAELLVFQYSNKAAAKYNLPPTTAKLITEGGMAGSIKEYARNVSSSKLRVTSQPQATSSSYNANNPNAQAALNKKFRALEDAQREVVKIQELPDGRIRYYARERSSKTPGPTRGAGRVTEYDPKTGQMRAWDESHDYSGNVTRVHPKMINGQNVHGQHYPPTKAELESFILKSRGPQ